MRAVLFLGVVGMLLLLAAGCSALFPPAGTPWAALLLVYLMSIGGRS